MKSGGHTLKKTVLFLNISFQILRSCLAAYRQFIAHKIWKYCSPRKNHFTKWRISSENTRREGNLRKKIVKSFQQIWNSVQVLLN